MDGKIEYIRVKLTNEDLLLQLAEEAAELGHAALKLCRVLTGRNPTPQNMRGAVDNLNEEIADVALVLKTLGYDLESDYDPNRQGRMENKLARWVHRLREQAGEE